VQSWRVPRLDQREGRQRALQVRAPGELVIRVRKEQVRERREQQERKVRQEQQELTVRQELQGQQERKGHQEQQGQQERKERQEQQGLMLHQGQERRQMEQEHQHHQQGLAQQQQHHHHHHRWLHRFRRLLPVSSPCKVLHTPLGLLDPGRQRQFLLSFYIECRRCWLGMVLGISSCR
jgi:hypothetical protein